MTLLLRKAVSESLPHIYSGLADIMWSPFKKSKIKKKAGGRYSLYN